MADVFFTDVGVVPEHDTVSVPSLQEDIFDLRLKERSLDARRRDALNKILDIKGCIRVFCRVRSLRTSLPAQSPIRYDEESITVKPVGGTKKEFFPDRLFAPKATQDDVFGEVEPVLRSALDGNNVCIFAYGQTGTGKTFTMEGTDAEPGIVPRSIQELFRQAPEGKFELSISMVEVYMGGLRDLLVKSSSRKSVNILSGRNGSVEIEGLTEVPVPDFKHAYRWYAKGKRMRSTSCTNVNDTSSRSHCLTRITISRSGSVSKLWMVDLGGSERLLKTGAAGKTLDEGKAINLSLSALADVIASLKKKRSHVPYRNSKLTQILSDSLGDRSKVLMIVHVSNSDDDVNETICSLNFAKRVRAVESNQDHNEDLKKQKEMIIADLTQVIDENTNELKRVRNQIEELGKHDKFQEVSETLQNTKKIVSSVPRFMTSTESSRQRLRHSASAEAKGKPTRIKLVLSQSLSYSKPSPSYRNAKVTTSQPVLRATVLQHKRRMSDFL